MLGRRDTALHWRLLLVAVLALGVAAAGRENLRSKKDADKLTKIYDVNINKLIDKHIVDIRASLMSLDPTTLEDVEYRVLTMSYILTRGWMQNLPLLSRSGNCSFKYKDQQLTANLNFMWSDIAFDYRYEFKTLLIKKVGDFHGQMYNLFVNTVYKYDFKTYKLTLDHFNFDKVGKIKLSSEGNIFDKLGKVVIKVITKLCKNTVLKVIERRFRTMLEHKLPETNEVISALQEQYLSDAVEPGI